MKFNKTKTFAKVQIWELYNLTLDVMFSFLNLSCSLKTTKNLKRRKFFNFKIIIHIK